MAVPDLCRIDCGFGVDANDPLEIDLTEPLALIARTARLGVAAVNISCGSPYYNPHIQRPAIFPPSDGYLPPEDPLVGVSRQIDAARQCKRPCPTCRWSARATRTCKTICRTWRKPWCAPAGSTRSVWAGWCSRIRNCRPIRLQAHSWQRKRVCRTFSDCTTAPAQRARLRLLSARSVLQSLAGSRGGQRLQARRSE